MQVDGEHGVIAAGAAIYPRVVVHGDRLVVGYARGVAWDYFVGGSWEVVESVDGMTWSPCDDPTIGFHWPASSARERHDRATLVLADGTWCAVGAVGWQQRDASERAAAIAAGLFVTPAPPQGNPGQIGVGCNAVFVQKSYDAGQSWSRREVELAPAGWTLGLNREVTLPDGAILMPLRQRSRDAAHGQFLVLKVAPGDPDRIRVYAVPRDLDGTTGSEAAIAHVGGDRIVMLVRADSDRGGDGRMLTSWSEDAGQTWSFPTATELRGRPPHLLQLDDGRLLATYGHQWPPYGVLAAISADGGETWQTNRVALVAADDDATVTSYHPMTVQCADGSLFTCYYANRDGVGRARCVRWQLPW